MTIFKHKETGHLYTITRNISGTCVCGKCVSGYTATEYPRGMFARAMNLSTLDEFEAVGER